MREINSQNKNNILEIRIKICYTKPVINTRNEVINMNRLDRISLFETLKRDFMN